MKDANVTRVNKEAIERMIGFSYITNITQKIIVGMIVRYNICHHPEYPLSCNLLEVREIHPREVATIRILIKNPVFNKTSLSNNA